jgi:hypothetical protein
MWRLLPAVVASSALLVAFPATTAARAHRLPDLTPSKLRLDIGRGGGGCTFAFTLTIKNKGGADAGPYSTDVAIFRDDVEVVEFPIFSDGTEAHGTSVLTSSFGDIAGTYRVAIDVNRFNPIPESDFTNNSLTSRSFACPHAKRKPRGVGGA